MFWRSASCRDHGKVDEFFLWMFGHTLAVLTLWVVEHRLG